MSADCSAATLRCDRSLSRSRPPTNPAPTPRTANVTSAHDERTDPVVAVAAASAAATQRPVATSRDRCAAEHADVEADQPDPGCERDSTERREHVEEHHRAERHGEPDGRDGGDDGGPVGKGGQRHCAPAS